MEAAEARHALVMRRLEAEKGLYIRAVSVWEEHAGGNSLCVCV